jgi:hypothetical protein
MKKIIIIFTLFLAGYSCTSNNKSNTSDTTNSNTSLDTASATKGISEGSLNSNDTAAMRAVDPNKKTDTTK